MQISRSYEILCVPGTFARNHPCYSQHTTAGRRLISAVIKRKLQSLRFQTGNINNCLYARDHFSCDFFFYQDCIDQDDYNNYTKPQCIKVFCVDLIKKPTKSLELAAYNMTFHLWNYHLVAVKKLIIFAANLSKDSLFHEPWRLFSVIRMCKILPCLALLHRCPANPVNATAVSPNGLSGPLSK